ncbi:pentapeptide repeat-containing protein [Erythrobacter donghaensis]|uniref:pentapeptide repeat-containing protein n=1 Tax=Erythrobacter donghaensis TaxID=267135 RepID=UPI000A3791A4|nr:pentapeptide repeat-containing protein [Erythrobacter donghaensis]
MLVSLAELVALTLGLAARQPVEPPPAPTMGDEEIEVLVDCAATRNSFLTERAGWAIIDARGMTRPEALAAQLRGIPASQRTVIYRGEFRGGDMRALAPQLAGACLVDTILDGSNWEDTAIPQLRLVRVSLREAKAARVVWPGLSTYGTNFEGTDFSGASLTDMRFVSAYQGASFGDVSFRGAKLSGASFACGITVNEWCINAGPDLTGADLTGADVSGLGLWDESMNTGAVLGNTTVSPRSLVNLGAARITGPLRLATYFTPTYPDPETAPVSVMVSAEAARALIDGTLAASAKDDRASFDCAKAASPVETIICGEYASGLRRLDRELAEVWGRLRAAGKGDLADQRRWLRARSECGEDQTCLGDRYEARIAFLYGKLGPGITLAPGESVTYHSDLMPLPEAMRSGALYKRILPVLIDMSYQRVTLTGNADGSIAAEGDAVGGNAHLCNLNAAAAKFDPKTGWWTAVSEIDGAVIPLFRVDGRRIHFRYSGNLGDTPVEASDVISCGARAGFDSGIDLTPR